MWDPLLKLVVCNQLFSASTILLNSKVFQLYLAIRMEKYQRLAWGGQKALNCDRLKAINPVLEVPIHQQKASTRPFKS